MLRYEEGSPPASPVQAVLSVPRGRIGPVPHPDQPRGMCVDLQMEQVEHIGMDSCWSRSARIRPSTFVRTESAQKVACPVSAA
jgi:hypothetical protein